jgi:hypothetical protein
MSGRKGAVKKETYVLVISRLGCLGLARLEFIVVLLSVAYSICVVTI